MRKRSIVLFYTDPLDEYLKMRVAYLRHFSFYLFICIKIQCHIQSSGVLNAVSYYDVTLTYLKYL